MTACSFAVSAHVWWNWAARAARTAIPPSIRCRTLSTCRSLDMRRLGSIRRHCRAFVQRLAGWISKPSSQLRNTGTERELVRVATFNINNINKRLDNLLAWLAKAEPDVVSLQELKAEQGAFPVNALRTLGYEAVWQGERSWNGVAILARNHTPVLTCASLPGARSRVDSEGKCIRGLPAATGDGAHPYRARNRGGACTRRIEINDLTGLPVSFS